MLIGTGSHTEIASVGGPESMRYVYALVHSIVRCVKRNSYSAFRLPTSLPLFHGSDPAAAVELQFITYISQSKIIAICLLPISLPFSFMKINLYIK